MALGSIPVPDPLGENKTGRGSQLKKQRRTEEKASMPVLMIPLQHVRPIVDMIKELCLKKLLVTFLKNICLT